MGMAEEDVVVVVVVLLELEAVVPEFAARVVASEAFHRCNSNWVGPPAPGVDRWLAAAER